MNVTAMLRQRFGSLCMETLMGIARKVKVCEVCGQPSEETICDECAQRIRGEAVGDIEEETKEEEGEIPE